MKFGGISLHAILATSELGTALPPAYADEPAQDSELIALGDAGIEAEVRGDAAVVILLEPHRQIHLDCREER